MLMLNKFRKYRILRLVVIRISLESSFKITIIVHISMEAIVLQINIYLTTLMMLKLTMIKIIRSS